MSKWIKTFRAQRRVIERGIRKPLSKYIRPVDPKVTRRNERLAALEIAEEATGVIDALEEKEAEEGAEVTKDELLATRKELRKVADKLEEKLVEMANAIIDAKIQLPKTLTDSLHIPDVIDLMEEGRNEERSWLFIGGMVEILFKYRNQGAALVLNELDKLLKRLDSSAKGIIAIIGELDDHLVIEQSIDIDQREQISKFLNAVHQTRKIYNENNIRPFLENNPLQLRSQFLLACAQLSLQLYGNVSIKHLTDLYEMKCIYKFNVAGAFGVSMPLADDEYKYFERKLNMVLDRVYNNVRRESWPILHLYKHNKRFGRKEPLSVEEKKDSNDQSGIEEHSVNAPVPNVYS